MKTYNDTYQNSIKTTPLSVLQSKKDDNQKDLKVVYKRLENRKYDMNPTLTDADARLYNLGDKVRIRLEMEKRAGRNWSRDYFIVKWRGISKYGPQYSKTIYQLKTPDGQIMPHYFQNDQLLPYHAPVNLMAEDIPQSMVQYIKEPTKVPFYIDPDDHSKGTEEREAYIVKFVGEKDLQEVERSKLKEDIPKMLKKFDAENRVTWDPKSKKGFMWKRAAKPKRR